MLFLLLIIGTILSFLSLHHKLPFISWFLYNFERAHVHPGKGAICYLIGALFAVILFPQDIALASIMILALADSVSHYVGFNHGRIPHPFNKEKFLEGSVAGILAGFLGAWIFVSSLEAFIAAFAAMVVEGFEIQFNGKLANDKLVDDNILIPLVAGACILLLRWFVHFI